LAPKVLAATAAANSKHQTLTQLIVQNNFLRLFKEQEPKSKKSSDTSPVSYCFQNLFLIYFLLFFTFSTVRSPDLIS
jgi:hypothetical protein